MSTRPRSAKVANKLEQPLRSNAQREAVGYGRLHTADNIAAVAIS